MNIYYDLPLLNHDLSLLNHAFFLWTELSHNSKLQVTSLSSRRGLGSWDGMCFFLLVGVDLEDGTAIMWAGWWFGNNH